MSKLSRITFPTTLEASGFQRGDLIVISNNGHKVAKSIVVSSLMNVVIIRPANWFDTVRAWVCGGAWKIWWEVRKFYWRIRHGN